MISQVWGSKLVAAMVAVYFLMQKGYRFWEFEQWWLLSFLLFLLIIMWFPIRKILPKNAKSILLNKIHLENSTASVNIINFESFNIYMYKKLFKLGVLSIETRNKIEIIKKLLKGTYDPLIIHCSLLVR